MANLILIQSLLLGMQHSFEPDHIAAVSVLTAGKEKPLTLRAHIWRSSQWALGHSFTLILLSIGALILKSSLPENIGTIAEWFVGPIMIWIGIKSIWLGIQNDLHKSENNAKVSSANRSLGIGMLHGMAGTGGACTVALTMAADNSFTALWIIILQSVGILLTMTLYGYLLRVSFTHLAKRSSVFFKYIMMVTGLFSTAIGLWILKGLVF